MDLYDYVDERGTNIIKEWTLTLQPRDRAKLQNKLEMLKKTTDYRQLPGLMAGPGIQGEQEIYKLQIGKKAETALRPMVCRGPFNKNTQITLLLGAQEKDRKLPAGVAKAAEANRRRILEKPNKHWCAHEWVRKPNEHRE